MEIKFINVIQQNDIECFFSIGKGGKPEKTGISKNHSDISIKHGKNKIAKIHNPSKSSVLGKQIINSEVKSHDSKENKNSKYNNPHMLNDKGYQKFICYEYSQT